jgi:cellulose biosynthesis protein BcsQ
LSSVNFSFIKVSELAELCGNSTALISRYFKNADEPIVTRVNKRITGISPEGAEAFLKSVGFNYFYKPAISSQDNSCGGVGKSTSTVSLCVSLRRIVSRKTAIVINDQDSQYSLTKQITGNAARDDEFTLYDYLHGKASIDDLLIPLNDNIWIIRSNFNLMYADRALTKPQEIKTKMFNFYSDIFNKLGSDTKIFQDNNPQHSNLKASYIAALFQLSPHILTTLAIPMRSDEHAINGAHKLLNEVQDIAETFSFENKINIQCFLSKVDYREVKDSEIKELIHNYDNVRQYFSLAAIRYSKEITASINQARNIYSHNSKNKAAVDYQQLLQYLFNS